MIKCVSCKKMFIPTSLAHPKTCDDCLRTPDGYPVVQGAIAVRMISRRRWEAPHVCRHCKAVFFRADSGHINLCKPCSDIPKKELRSTVNARARAKRLERKVEGFTPGAPKIGPEFICKSPLEGVDRGTLAGFKRYMTERPVYFEMLFRVKATDGNIKAIWRGMR